MAGWVLAFRLRYKKTLEAPNRLVVWDMENDTEYETDKFEMEDCKIVVAYGNQIKQEKWCGAKMILEVYKHDVVQS
mgnify:CR=1 FL=1|tara:strand:+ start:17981 stop:18208 length:228 start_codon:yes stop_codon:yes gene_type:complete